MWGISSPRTATRGCNFLPMAKPALVDCGAVKFSIWKMPHRDNHKNNNSQCKQEIKLHHSLSPFFAKSCDLLSGTFLKGSRSALFQMKVVPENCPLVQHRIVLSLIAPRSVYRAPSTNPRYNSDCWGRRRRPVADWVGARYARGRQTEYLLGPLVALNLINLGITDQVRQHRVQARLLP
jgi:hypothetical protein